MMSYRYHVDISLGCTYPPTPKGHDAYFRQGGGPATGGGGGLGGHDSSFRVGRPMTRAQGGDDSKYHQLLTKTFVWVLSSLCTCLKHHMDACFAPIASL